VVDTTTGNSVVTTIVDLAPALLRYPEE
jgi:hypothetical protein